ncbi:MAG: 3-deoxy-D-manno-octulosonic acid transferase [Pirellulaceae bacterium]|nr:3-deoxy-D-manno-octulosonic acid transferase [Pirellulaceae bacterium]
MPYLLNFAYLLLLAALSPWLLWQAWRTGKYREGWAAKLRGRVPHRQGNARCLWLHAVSVGEVNLLAPIIERFERRHPDWEIVISTTTQTGHALAQKRYAPRMVFYCPLDFTWAVRSALRDIRPDLLVLAELELWPNLVRAARLAGAKVAVINARLGEKSFRGYRRIGWLARRALANIDLIAAQNGEYATRFLALGAPAEAVHVTGSIKFDGARTDRANSDTQRLARLAEIKPDDMVFLAGSTQEPEESLALDSYLALAPAHPMLQLILVPRHPERFDAVAELLNRRGVRWQRRSRLEADRAASGVRILLVDAVGELGAWWGTAHIAFVGGSLGQRGGQNMIEPAAYGAAVSFGPNTWNFRDVAALLVQHQAATIVSGGGELTAFVEKCLTDPSFAPSLGQAARDLVLAQQGAADRTLALLDALLGPDSQSARHAA